MPRRVARPFGSRFAAGFAAALPIVLAMGMAGCALTPDYERPELDVPEVWQEPSVTAETVANVPWWNFYWDPVLRGYIELALEENKDLATALARVAQARYQVTFTRADQFPFLTGGAGVQRGRDSEEVVPLGGTHTFFSLAADITFEVDLWRRYARASEAARADLLASEEAYRNVTISLVASVASTYLLLRDADARLQISQGTVESRQKSLAIIQARFDKGTVPELDVNQAEIELTTAEVAVARFEREVIQAQNALRVLLGKPPGPIERGYDLSEQALLVEVPAGLPSELLQRRPDLVAAEQNLVAETARIGVAEAMRYPSISLSGSIGAVSEELSDLTTNEAKAWNLAAGLMQPLFNAGQLKAQAESQRARAQEALSAYEATLLDAFREVEDALVAIRTRRAEHDALSRQVKAARNAARLSRARYDGGVVDYLEVLDSERSLFSAALDESSAQREALDAVVRLYKALGGGWLPADEEEDADEAEEIDSEEERP